MRCLAAHLQSSPQFGAHLKPTNIIDLYVTWTRMRAQGKTAEPDKESAESTATQCKGFHRHTLQCIVPSTAQQQACAGILPGYHQGASKCMPLRDTVDSPAWRCRQHPTCGEREKSDAQHQHPSPGFRVYGDMLAESGIHTQSPSSSYIAPKRTETNTQAVMRSGCHATPETESLGRSSLTPLRGEVEGGRVALP